jgi:hypothetical protein
MQTQPTRMYCGELPDDYRGGTYLTHFFQSKLGVKMCMDDRRPFPVFEVVVSEGTDTPDSYWGWWDSGRQAFNIVFARKLLVEVCFPYGSKAEEDRGRGKLMPVNIEILREVNVYDKAD